MYRVRSLITACSLLLSTSAAFAADQPDFPRLAGYNIASPHNYEDPAYQAKLAKLDFSILNIWGGWENGRGTTYEQVVKNIKNINPDTKVFVYHISMELNENDINNKPHVFDKVNQMKWWSYAQGTASRVVSGYGRAADQPIYEVNITEFTPRDSNGHRYWEWEARDAINSFYKPNPSIDGFFEDNVFVKPRNNMDLNRDGVTDSQSSAQAARWLREGYRARFEFLKRQMPGKYQLANIVDWGHKDTVLPEYQGMAHGGVMEGIIGTPYGPETWAGWQEMMRWYRKSMSLVAQPKLVIFHQRGVRTDYQAMRYGLASCLQDDGYYNFFERYTDVIWFDEYNAKLGQAVSPPSTAAWQKGVYRRDFEGGIALVNPKGNGPVEVTLEEDFRRIAGKQTPGVNNGQLTRTVKLNDRDGIILMRTKTKSPPESPKLSLRE